MADSGISELLRDRLQIDAAVQAQSKEEGLIFGGSGIDVADDSWSSSEKLVEVVGGSETDGVVASRWQHGMRVYPETLVGLSQPVFQVVLRLEAVAGEVR